MAEEPVNERETMEGSSGRDDEVRCEAVELTPDVIARWERLRILVEAMQIRRGQR